MQKTDDLPDIKLRQVCPGCQRNLPFDTLHFEYCPRCGTHFFCKEKCMRSCVLCGRRRDYICMEQISLSGLICDKCKGVSIPE